MSSQSPIAASTAAAAHDSIIQKDEKACDQSLSALISLHTSATGGVLYGWGRCPGLPVSCLDRSGLSALPARIDVPQSIQPRPAFNQVSCGEQSCAAVTTDGRLFTWGSGRFGRLGHGSDHSFSSPESVDYFSANNPIFIEFGIDPRVAYVSLGQTHGGCFTRSGHAFTWGKSSKAALGMPVKTAQGKLQYSTQQQSFNPQLLIHPETSQPFDRVFFLDCSVDNTALLCGNLIDRNCWIFGSNTNGKLGIIHSETKESIEIIEQPILHPCLPSIQHLSLGSNYSAFVGSSGQLFTCGLGYWGNLGHGDRLSRPQPKQVIFPRPDIRIVRVSCTRNQSHVRKPEAGAAGQEGPHTFAISDDSELFAFGTAHKGMLGNLKGKVLCPPNFDQLRPFSLSSGCLSDSSRDPAHFHHQPVRLAISSHIHSAVLTSDGLAYTFGCGSDGRCGVQKYLTGLHGARSRLKCYISVPQPVLIDEKSPAAGFLDLASGRCHMLAIVRDTNKLIKSTGSARK